MALAVGSRIGPYRIEGRLGAGGMGEVYRAVQVNLHREVALKVMKPDLAADRDFVERFMREARAGAAISHPHVVAIHDADTRDSLLYMAFEFVPGGDLSHLLATRGPLPAGEALRLIAECADGLQAIHAAGMVHRDLKPQNIFIDSAGRAKLGDLGLARSAVGDDRMTATGAAMGTPAFMAPEQAEGLADIDIRADIHALGGTLYTLLTGQMPFVAATPWAVVAKVMSQPPPDPRAVMPGVPAEVAALVQRAMAKRREERFATPAEFRAEVLRVAGAIAPGATGAGGAAALPPTPATGAAAGPPAPTLAPTVVTTQALAPATGPSPAVSLAATVHPNVPTPRRAPVALIAAAAVAVAVMAGLAVAATWATPAPVVVGPPHHGPATAAVVVDDRRGGAAPLVATGATSSSAAAADPVVARPGEAAQTAPADHAAPADARAAAAQARNQVLSDRRAPLLVLDTTATPPADIESQLDLYAVVVGLDDGDLKRWRAKIAAIKALRADLGGPDAEDGLRAAQPALVAKLDQLAKLVGEKDADVVAARAWVAGPPVPAWATANGADDHGRWCDLVFAGVTQRLRLCRGGGFTMGSPADEPGRATDEVAHHVTVGDFWIADSPCTQELWVAVMGDNPSYFTNDPARPVEQVSWDDAQRFLARLTRLVSTGATAAAADPDAADATSAADATAPAAATAAADATSAADAGAATDPLRFRLPTEAEWEYACRAGTTGAYGGDGVIADMGWTIPADGEALWAKAFAAGTYDEVNAFIANHGGTGGYQTRAVRHKQPNAWGLYDMHGNVWQWCQDAYRPYDPADATDPDIAPDADHHDRVDRGGGWTHPASMARSAARAHDPPTTTNWAMGFRFAVTAEAAP